MAYFNLFNFQALLVVFATVLVSGGYSMHLFERQYLVRQGTASGTFSAAGAVFAPDAHLLSTAGSRSGNANGGPVYVSTNVSGVPRIYLVATGTDHSGMNISGYPNILFERSAFASFPSSLWFSIVTSCVSRVCLIKVSAFVTSSHDENFVFDSLLDSSYIACCFHMHPSHWIYISIYRDLTNQPSICLQSLASALAA